MPRLRYIMVGGFLGAGKTTAMVRLAQHFRGQGKRVGLITNDQSVGLVDTAMVGANDFPVAEITGGCFCCKFNSLMEAAQGLTRQARPDVFLAEPVGSCTDLRATVAYPLRKLYGSDYAVAPLSVLVDPVRAGRILGLAPGKNFSEKVVYIYLKQLEEAEIIVINKCDLLSADQADSLAETLRTRFPGASVISISARHGTNLDDWLAAIDAEQPAVGQSMDVDYDTYAEGEALLGWMNCTVTLTAAESFDGNHLLADLAADLHRRLADRGIEVAHLKMTLTPDVGNDLGVVNLVRTDGQAELSHRLVEPLTSGQLLVNLRAETDPESWQEETVQAVSAVAGKARARAVIDHLEAFRPGRPVPTHRFAEI